MKYVQSIRVLSIDNKFRKDIVLSVIRRNSGGEWHSVSAITTPAGVIPERMVRNQESKEAHASLGTLAVILGAYPGFPVKQIETHLIAWLEMELASKTYPKNK